MKKYNIKDALEKKKIIPFSVGPRFSSKELESGAEKTIEAAEEAITLTTHPSRISRVKIIPGGGQ